MSVRGFLTWYIIAIVFVGAAGASLVQGAKWQHAQKMAAVSRSSVAEPAAPRQEVTEAAPTVPTVPLLTALPALRSPPAHERMALRATAQSTKPVPRRVVVARAAARPTVSRLPAPPAVVRYAPPYPDAPRAPYPAPWQAAAYPPPPPPYANYSYRAYGPYSPSYVPYGYYSRFGYY